MIQTTSQNITKLNNINEEIERHLTFVFEQELRTKDSILLSYNPLLF